MTLDPEQLVGRSVGPFSIDRLLGSGSFAWVFSGRHRDEGTAVALKILRPRYAGDPQFETRFRNESRIAADLAHDNIVRILEVGQDAELTYFAMDFYAETLGDRLETQGPLPELEVVRIASAVARGLQFAHDAGIVHRDIKADNILIAADGHVAITDFGIAKAVSGYASATGQNMTIGTPHYVSPEQAQGRKLDGRSDLYALGVAMYKAVTGQVPFTSTDWFELARMHVEDPPAAPREHRPDVSARLERVILRLLAKHPDERYPSAAELLADLESIASPSRATATFGLDSVSTEIRAHKPRAPWVVPAAAVAVVLAVAVLVVLFVR